MITLKEIKKEPIFITLIEKSNAYLSALGFTDHGLRHVSYVSRKTASILRELDYDNRTVELGAIAGYLHDVGNIFNRANHGISGANLVYFELRNLGMDLEEISVITTAIANHEEEIGQVVSPASLTVKRFP